MNEKFESIVVLKHNKVIKIKTINKMIIKINSPPIARLKENINTNKKLIVDNLYYDFIL